MTRDNNAVGRVNRKQTAECMVYYCRKTAPIAEALSRGWVRANPDHYDSADAVWFCPEHADRDKLI